MQKFDSEKTYSYQKIWKFFSGKTEIPGIIEIMRMKTRRISACKKKT